MDIRDSQSATWKDVVYAVLRQLGTSVSLDKIYEEIEPHKKAQGNPHWKPRSDRPYRCLLKLDLLHMLHMENGVLHKEKDTMSRMIQTNMGEIPLQDYLDIRALECGFDSYKELEEARFSIEIPETSKEKEQTLVPRPDWKLETETRKWQNPKMDRTSWIKGD